MHEAWHPLRTTDAATNDCPNVSSVLKVAVITAMYGQVLHYIQGSNRVSCSGYVQHSVVFKSVKQGGMFYHDTKITCLFMKSSTFFLLVKQRIKTLKIIIACLRSFINMILSFMQFKQKFSPSTMSTWSMNSVSHLNSKQGCLYHKTTLLLPYKDSKEVAYCRTISLSNILVM